MQQLSTVGILGCGTMGPRVAVVCALKSYNVVLWDYASRPSFAGDLRKTALLEAKLAGLTRTAVSEALDRIELTNALSDLQRAQAIIECAKEDLTIKAQLLSDAEAICPSALFIASSTSSLSIETLSQAFRAPEIFLGVHFFNPPLKIDLVEVISSSRTGQTPQEAALAFVHSLGKDPLILNDSPGFVVNRILFAMIAEAVSVLEAGEVSAEQIDNAFRLSCGHPMGPLQLADFIGLDVCQKILDELHARTGQDKYVAPPLLRELVTEGCLGRKTASGFYRYKA